MNELTIWLVTDHNSNVITIQAEEIVCDDSQGTLKFLVSKEIVARFNGWSSFIKNENQLSTTFT